MNHPRFSFERLRSGHRTDPLGVPLRAIPLTWSLAGEVDVDRDVGFEVIVSESAEAVAQDSASCWRASGLPTARVVYDERFTARARRYWRVVTLAGGQRVVSDIATFEAGISSRDWIADWIAAPLNPFRRQTWDPAPLLRTVVEIEKPKSARAFVTALGIYRLWINGQEVTADELLRPGWTDYSIRVYHQTYDVTRFLRPGSNAVGIELAKGWYAGRVGLQREPGLYGEQPAVRFQLEVDGSVHVSDRSWRYGYGAVQVSDMLLGETQDVRREPMGWSLPDFDDGEWKSVDTPNIDTLIEPQPHDSPRFHRVHVGTVVHQHGRGPVVFDFGQNLVGWTRLTTRTLPKADVVVRHGEILTPSNLVYRDNLRSAFQEDVYFTGDADQHRLEPRFTVHGFRYAEVWGLPSADPFGIFELMPNTTVEAVSIDAGMEHVGSFECSDPRINAVAAAIEWTVRDNFLEVITDCPQREERLGWLGDAGVIGPTAAYYFDIAAFVSKFVQDAEDTQGADGTVRSYAPAVPPGDQRDGAPGWADGYVRLVHLLGERYGDVSAVHRHYDSLRRYLDFVDRQNPSGIRTEAVGADFGDWLSLPDDPNEPTHPGYEWTEARSTTPRPVHDTAHTFRSYTQLAQLADWLGYHDEAERCRVRASEIGAAYRVAFVASDGSITGDTQTAYAQALGYGLLDGTEVRSLALKRFVEKVESQGYITTGIHGVEHILTTLARNGHADLAYALLDREDMPGWLHMIAMGATTVWEKWDGIRVDGTMSTAEMNSMNHCALGAIGRFLFEDVAGIDATTTTWSGVVRVAPSYTRTLEWARASYNSPSGLVSTRWQWDGESIVQEVTIPPGITAEVHVPEEFACENSTVLGPGHHTLILRRLG